jgi:HemY protein
MRLISYLILLALLVGGAVWLADRPGAVAVDWLGWHLETSVPVLLGLLAVLAVALVLCVRLALAVWRLPTSMLEKRRHARRRKGYQALTDGLAAAAGGEVKRARQLSTRAQKLLADPGLTAFLSAQTAQLSGDAEKAQAHFAAMIERPETASLGLRGLLDQAIKRGDDAAAISLATRARILTPGDAGLADTLLKLLIRQDRLSEALDLVADARRHKAFTVPEAARRRALLLNQRADKAAGEEGGEASAANYARQALAADPSLAPAACRLAAALVAGGKLRRAASVVEKAWAREPLPELARAYAGLRPGEEPLQRLRRIEKLAAVHPHDVESHLAIAEAALDAKLWGQARKHLLAAVALRSSARPYHLLARLERAEYKNEDAARAWERKAHEAPGDPAWICADCGHVSNDWSLTCPQCDAVDSQGRGIPKPIVLPVPKVG